MPKSKGQEFINRSHGQQMRRVKETLTGVHDTLADVADNQQAIAHVVVAHEERHDQADRDFKMVKARLDAVENELRRQTARD